MRAVTLQLNIRASNDMNWSVKSEILVENDENPEEAGVQAAQFLWRFQQGMLDGIGDLNTSGETEDD